MDGLSHPRPYMAHPESQLRPPPAAPPGAAAWYPASSQFQYQAQPQWDPHHHPLNPPPHAPYPASHAPAPPYHYPSPPVPPRPPHLPPPLPSHSQAYPPLLPSSQAWGNQSWGHHQGWEYSERNTHHSNEEDLAARAKAWAAARAAMDQHQIAHSSQFVQPVGERMEEQHNHLYQEQLHQQHTQASTLNYYNGGPSHANHLQQSTTYTSGPSSYYVSDGQTSSYGNDNKDGGAFAGTLDSSSSVSPPLHSGVPSIHQQEVPSSYSSNPGNGGALSRNEALPTSIALGTEQHHSQLHLPMNPSHSILTEHPPYYNAGDMPPESVIDAKVVNNKLYHPINYVHPEQCREDNLAPWASAIASHGVAISSVSPHLPAKQHVEPPFLSPSMPGPTGFHATVSASSFALTAGATALHPATLFSGDANGGLFNVSERPKKAAVPNWLREEIIKKKTIIASSIEDHNHEPRGLSPSNFEGEDADNSLRKGDFSDRKSIDSAARSTDNEDDDEEDDADAAKTSAINQQIKRILTEVLLKVTDELLDEIATKVMNEGDDQIEEDDVVGKEAPVNQVASPPPAFSTLKASAKVLIPAQVKRVADGKKVEDENSIVHSRSRSAGDLLGLGNYESDEEEDEVESSPNEASPGRQNKHNVHESVEKKILEIKHQDAKEAHWNVHNKASDVPKGQILQDHVTILNNGVIDKEEGRTNPGGRFPGAHGGDHAKISGDTREVFHERSVHAPHEPSTESGDGGKVYEKLERPCGDDFVGGKSDKIDKGVQDSKKERNKQRDLKEEKNVSKAESDSKRNKRDEKKDIRNGRMVSSKDGMEMGRDSSKEDRNERKISSKEDGVERFLSSKEERFRDRGSKPGEKVKESDSGKIIYHRSLKDGRKGIEEEVKKSGSNREEINYRRKEQKEDDKEDRSMWHRGTTDVGRRHKRHRSPSISRGRKSSRDKMGSDNESGSSGEVSAKSRGRKVHSNKRASVSPSPTRSRRRRQDSRSPPHSKRSQRRHSPYSSHVSRRRRSRSGSPIRNRR